MINSEFTNQRIPSQEGLRGVAIDLQSVLKTAKKAALEAGKEIMKIYESGDFSIEAKADNSPLTLADKAAHDLIMSSLEKTNLPVLSEEGKEIPFDERSKWEYFWMVDPLDGTKEFINKNGEFTVNIALIHKRAPILGIVYPPYLGDLYFALSNEGAFVEKEGVVQKLQTSSKKLSERGLKVVASRSHMNSETENYLLGLNEPDIVSKGSSLKFLLVASGEADLYPRFGPTMKWDTAAANIIVNEAGGIRSIERPYDTADL